MTILVIVLILWLLGFIGGIGGNLIHILIVVAVIILIFNLGLWPAIGLTRVPGRKNTQGMKSGFWRD